jgi:hypothetical protein
MRGHDRLGKLSERQRGLPEEREDRRREPPPDSLGAVDRNVPVVLLDMDRADSSSTR